MAEPRFRSERLAAHHNHEAFACGVEPLDRYLRQQASQEQRRNVAVPYVLVETETAALAGYYTISALTIVPASLPPEMSKKLPRYETYPAILIGRLALDQRYQGQGLGRLLLVDALSRCLDLSTEIGAIAVVVDARDDKARAFYEHVGFLQLLDNAYRLYIPMASIAHLLRQPVQVSGKVVTPS